jgi:hypothetical protein
MKDKETLEEAAEHNSKKVGSYAGYQDFIAGAKWQAERMYSEEEIKEAYWNRTDEIDVDGYWINDPEKDLEELLKEMKKTPMTFVPDEKIYSKEDMLKCWNAAYIDALAIDEETYKPLFFEDFIEQFKKK